MEERQIVIKYFLVMQTFLVNCDILFVVSSLTMSWFGIVMTVLMCITDIRAVISLHRSYKHSLPLLRVGVAQEVRIMLFIVVCMGTEDMLIREENKWLRFFVNMLTKSTHLGLLIGIYHSFIVRDLFETQRAKKIFFICCTLFCGIIIILMVLSNDKLDTSLFRTINAFYVVSIFFFVNGIAYIFLLLINI